MNTVFVLGAAVSGEFGFPLGAGLKTKIGELLDERSRTETVVNALASAGSKNIWEAVRLLCAGLPVAASIDNLLEFHGQDPDVVAAGKIGIATAILREEFSRPMGQHVDGELRILAQDNTLGDLLRLIIQGSKRENLVEAFSRVAFINFNYDRCLERFLFVALTIHLGLSADKAESIISAIPIWHPFGSLGPLFGDRAIPYGQRIDGYPLIEIAQSIRTFSEGMDSESGHEIKDLVASAERLIFLGCAHHPQNMALLAPTKPMRTARFYGTVYTPPPVDLLVQPSMSVFAAPAIAAFERSLKLWRKKAGQGSVVLTDANFRIEAATSRQLTARYGSEWTDLTRN